MDFIELSNLLDAKDKLIAQQQTALEIACMPKMAVTVETLRDKFAMAALIGILMNDNLLPGEADLIPYRASGCAYEIADAMMEARK